MNQCKYIFLGIVYLLIITVSEAQGKCTKCPPLSGLVCSGSNCGTVYKENGNICRWATPENQNNYTGSKPTIKAGSSSPEKPLGSLCTYEINESKEPFKLELKSPS